MIPSDGELERQLESIRFEPRASLGAEIEGRWKRGERPSPPPSRRRLWIGGALALVGLGGLLVGGYATGVARRLTVDRCCQDLDGGGDADDGVVVVSRRGVSIQYLKIYEDLDRSGNYTPGDPVRFIRQGTPVVIGPVEGGRTTEFCCLDYDGGGPSDDALVVVSHPPDRITMAAIYERRSTGSPVELR
jgi:hypothetical protein